MPKENLPIKTSNASPKTNGIFYLINRAFNGIGIVYGHFHPLLRRAAEVLGRPLEEKERQLLLKRAYKESPEHIFYAFLSDMEKNLYAQLKKRNKVLEDLRRRLIKTKLQSDKNMVREAKSRFKRQKKLKKYGVMLTQNQVTEEELEAYWHNEHGNVAVIESQIKLLKTMNKKMLDEFEYVMEALRKKSRRLASSNVTECIDTKERQALDAGYKFSITCDKALADSA